MGKKGIFGEKSAPVLLCHMQIPRGLLAPGFKPRPLHQWTETDGENWRARRKVPSRCHFVTCRFHVDCTGIEPRPPYWGVVEYSRELSCGHVTRLYSLDIDGCSLILILNIQNLTSWDTGPHS